MATTNDPKSDEQERQAKRDLETKLREALLSGPAEAMTCEDWDMLDRRIWESPDSATKAVTEVLEEGLHGHHERFVARRDEGVRRGPSC